MERIIKTKEFQNMIRSQSSEMLLPFRQVSKFILKLSEEMHDPFLWTAILERTKLEISLLKDFVAKKK